ncbi:MarR family transcriptional regulator [Actinomadura sp. 7K534]|uniref:MarR family winged helix-turn-helix transcriptional regulator n=1 Tax=Actinomadura sp. 7K534 TaxID=2530366 RepID=UPI00104CC4B5|nr:MarR family transcriptional regulator [Actinomadura sp. 7K534]TDB95785.1 MarR family transcriptional regulator [Actinomadura sp. 7K534]
MDGRDADTDRSAPTAGVPGSNLGWYLGVILRGWHEEVERAVEGVPHGTRGYQILSVVGHNSPPTQSGLAKHLQIDKTVMPYVIDALQDAGLVERRTDPKDRRVRRIVLTPHGERTLAELEARVRAAEDAVFAGMPARARQAFVEHAAQLAVSIHNAHPSIDPCIAVLDALVDPEPGTAKR